MNNIEFRISNNGVPHTLVEYKGTTFSICYFGKGEFYRIFLYSGKENTKLTDIKLNRGESFNLELVLKQLKANL